MNRKQTDRLIEYLEHEDILRNRQSLPLEEQQRLAEYDDPAFDPCSLEFLQESEELNNAIEADKRKQETVEMFELIVKVIFFAIPVILFLIFFF